MATGGININANLTLNPQSITAASKQVQQALGRITGQASEFQKSLDASTARVFAFGATTSILNGVGQAFKTLVANTIEVEKRITEIGSILGGTTSQLNALRSTIFSVAKDTGQAFSTTADAAAELARQGLSAEETAKRLSAALVLTRVSGLDSVKSVKALTSAINGFTSAGLTAEQITNKLIAVDTKFAVSAQDLAEGFSRAGSTAEDAGVSFDELLGIITAVEQKTARGGAVIGNALKSIFARLSRSTTIEDLKELGVEIDSSQTGIQKLQSLSAALEKVADPTVASKIKELAGGVFQINVVSAALKDLGSDTSIFAKAALTASSATNEAFTKNAALNTSINSQINSLVIGLTDLSSKIGEITFGPIAKNLLSLANTFTDFLQKAFDPEQGNKFIQGLFKTIGSFLAGPGLILITTAFLKIFTLVAKFAKEGFKTILEIGSQTEKIRGIEGGIVSLLSRDQQLRAVIASTTATQAQKEAAVISAIQKENLLLTQQEQLLKSIATAAAQRGVGGYSQTGGFSGRGGRRFAAGYMEEEATAKMLGASPSVKAKQGKGTIGGQRFIMNNQETEIPNFGRNGDSAVIPHYARGFIPNYAGPKVLATISKKTGYYVGTSLTEEQKQYNTRIQKQKEQSRLGKENLKDIKIKSGVDFSPIDANKVIGDQMPRIFTPLESGRVSKIIKGGSKLGYPDLDTKFNFRGVRAKTKNTELRSEFSNFFDKNGQFTQFADNTVLKFARNISSSFSLPPIEPTTISELTGVEGFKGAIRGAMGAIFDRAIISAVQTNASDDIEGNFDINARKGGLENVEKVFGKGSLPSSKLADLKIGMRGESPDSMIRKTLNTSIFKNLLDSEYKQRKIKEKDQISKFEKNKNGKAAGFIPNFNSVNKGIPVSQIRAHFDKSGSPIAVTNTRDEPNGLKDAIGREKQGIGMAAKGFIPNHARPAPPSPASTPDYSGFFGKTTAALFSLQLATNTLGDSQSEFNKKLNESAFYLGILNTVITLLPEKAKGFLIGKAAGVLKELITKGAVGTAGRAVGTAGRVVGTAGRAVGTAGRVVGTAGRAIAGAATNTAASAGAAITGITDIGAVGLFSTGAATIVGASIGTALVAGGIGYTIGEYIVNPIVKAVDEKNIKKQKTLDTERIVSGKIGLRGGQLDPTKLIRESKAIGLDTTELQNAYTKAAADLSTENVTQSQIIKIREKFSLAIKKQSDLLVKENDYILSDIKASNILRMQKEMQAARLSVLNDQILNFGKILDTVSTRLNQQKFAEGIAANVTTRTNAPYAEATKAQLGIRQAQTSAQQSKVGFMSNFAGADFTKIINSEKLLSSGKSGAQISQDMFTSYMKNGAKGVSEELEKYIKEGLDPEDAKKFKDTIISSADTLSANIADAMQKALNRETEIQNNLSELTTKIKDAGISFVTEAASKIKDLLSGPKLDPLALQDKFEQAAKFLSSGKKGDIAKGRDILASTSEDQKVFEQRYGKEKLAQLQTGAGLGSKQIGLAQGSATIVGTETSGIEKAIRENLSGVDLQNALKALQQAKEDPTKIQNLIDTIKQTFSQFTSVKTRERGGDIINSLTGTGKTGSSVSEIERSLQQNTLGGAAGMSADLKDAITAFKKNMSDPKLLQDVKDKLKEQYGGYAPKFAEKTGSLFERAATEAGAPKITQDPETEALKSQQTVLNAELSVLNTRIRELNKSFGDTGIPQAVTSLTNSVNAAATNLKGFQDFTANLNSLSDTVNGKLIDINNRLTTLGK